MTMHLCRQHLRIWQPENNLSLSRNSHNLAPQPAHWRPIALGVLQHAAAWAAVGHCALPVEVVACDMCATERKQG